MVVTWKIDTQPGFPDELHSLQTKTAAKFLYCLKMVQSHQNISE